MTGIYIPPKRYEYPFIIDLSSVRLGDYVYSSNYKEGLVISVKRKSKEQQITTFEIDFEGISVEYTVWGIPVGIEDLRENSDRLYKSKEQYIKFVQREKEVFEFYKE